MPKAAFRRARGLLWARNRSILGIQFLALAEAILILGLVIVAGLLLGLLNTRGVARIPHERLAELERMPQSAWLLDRLPAVEDVGASPLTGLAMTNTGLYPLVAESQFSPNPFRRAGGRLLGDLVNRFRPFQSDTGALQSLLIFGLLLLLATSLVGRARRALVASAVSQVSRGLRLQLHRQMYRLGHSALPTEGVGPILDLFTRDVNEIRDGLIASLEHTVRASILAVGLLLIALFLSPVLTVFLLSLGGIVWFLATPLSLARQNELDASARELGVYLLLLHEDLGMLRTVRVFNMEGTDKQRFQEHLSHYQAADERRLRVEGRRDPTTLLLAGTAAFLATGLLGYNILVGRLSLAAAITLVAVLAGLARPLRHGLDRRRKLRQAARAALAIEEFLDRRPELQMGVNARFLRPLQERISFENITLEDSRGRPLLEGFSAEIPAGGRTAIMGFDEEAKHAIACMIPRLIDPKVGRVRIDGMDLREATLESIRAQVALLLSADYIFSDSILNNIGLADPVNTLPRIIEAAKLAHAHSFIQDLPRGYETVIGPLGHPLLPDEAYRIALARAYLQDPSILIIEEPLTTLDDAVKPLIDDSIDRLSPGRTLIFLPHRLSTIRKCDQVLVIHNGRLEASGPPREVHGQSKLYRHLQYIEFNQFATGEIEAGQMGTEPAFRTV